jgi:ABC-2 type transport system ATP-binding protein
METVEDLCENISLVDNAKIVLHGSVAEIRASHATNTFIVGSRTSLNEAEFNMISQKEKNGIFESVLMKDSNETNNVLLKKLLNYTEVLSFEELLPSMNDIFLKTVKA